MRPQHTRLHNVRLSPSTSRRCPARPTKIKTCVLALVTAFAMSHGTNSSTRAQAQGAAAQTSPSQAVAFVGVNVVPMDRERVLENQTVLVRGGRIAEVGPASKVKVPEGALRVEGRGKYLMPGLAEMHGHLPPPNAGEAVTEAVLFLFVANGVTTVRGMFGFPNHTALRERVARGELLGPTLYVAGPALSGQNVKTPADAERLAREHKAAGFDLLKVHEGLSREAYDKIVETSNAVGLKFGGHVAEQVGLLHALKSRQSTIEHLDGYLEALEADDSPIKHADPQTRAQKLLEHLDERKLPALARATREAGVWNTPTMALWQTFFSDESVDSLRQRPEVRYAPAQLVQGWVQQRNAMSQNPDAPKPGEARRVVALRDRILKALADAGAKLLLGSDAPQLFSVPGFSLRRETAAMGRAGLTPYQILESGTRNPALYFDAANEFGTVEAGKRADLILLDANPLADVSNVFDRRAGVMARGRWLPQADIQKRLDAMAAANAAGK